MISQISENISHSEKVAFRKTVMLALILVLFLLLSCSDNSTSVNGDDDPVTIQDIDQHTYPVVRIGNQLWMAENLAVTRYRNGDAIPEVQGETDWIALNAGAWSRYNHLVANDLNFGKLYNWFAVSDPRGICPEGWKVPSDDDWKTLERHLGMSAQEANSSMKRGADANAGGKLKSGSFWESPNTGANNESGFNGNPGGRRVPTDGSFSDINRFGYWWTASEQNQAEAIYRSLYFQDADILRFYVNKKQGFSVRCIKG